MVFKKGNHPKTEFKKESIPWNKGKKELPKHSEEHKKKISNSLKNREFSKEHRKKLSKQRKGIKLSNETKDNISKNKKNLIKISLLGIGTGFFSAFNLASWGGIATFTFIIIPLSFLLIWLFKEKNNEENKKNILKNYLLFYLVCLLFTVIFSTIYGNSILGMFNHFISGTNILVTIVLLFLIVDYFLIINKKKYLKGNLEKYRVFISGGICPMIGHNEKKILDELEEELNYKIIRQYQIEGYFVDGYIKELNLCIEVDEKPKNKERDIEREKIIKEKLNCKFLRIEDYD